MDWNKKTRWIVGLILVCRKLSVNYSVIFLSFFFAGHSLFTNHTSCSPLFRGSVNRQALHLPPPCLFGGNASPKEVAFAHILRARAVCQMEEALWIQGMDGFGLAASQEARLPFFFGQGS